MNEIGNTETGATPVLRVATSCRPKLCERLNHYNTFQCVTAEPPFLHGMGGVCRSPVAAYAEVVGEQLRLRAVSYRDDQVRRGEGRRSWKASTISESRIETMNRQAWDKVLSGPWRRFMGRTVRTWRATGR